MKLLTFLLSAPMQSWGDDSRWDHRATAAMPGKSAIIGMLGCCLGYGRGDARLRELSEKLHVAVRADRSGRPMWDFQTVQNPGGKILNAMGKPRGETIITPKQYLQDAAFQVFVYGDVKMLDKCCQAMRHPCWAICLGRRSCPPALPVIPHLTEEYDTLRDALERYCDVHMAYPGEYAECQIEAVPGETFGGQVITRMDEVVRGDLNQYQERVVCTHVVKRRAQECT